MSSKFRNIIISNIYPSVFLNVYCMYVCTMYNMTVSSLSASSSNGTLLKVFLSFFQPKLKMWGKILCRTGRRGCVAFYSTTHLHTRNLNQNYILPFPSIQSSFHKNVLWLPVKRQERTVLYEWWRHSRSTCRCEWCLPRWNNIQSIIIENKRRN